MNYREIKPNGFLTNFIQSFWEYRTDEIEFEHTIVPDGYFDLITAFENNALSFVWLTGVWTVPINVRIPKSTRIVAIRFKLIAAEYLFNQEIKSILNTNLSLSLSFWNINRNQDSDFEKFVLDITNNLENSIRHLKEIDNRKLKLFELIYSVRNHSVSEISQKVHWSSRQINRYFNNQFGISLKAFQSIVRCYETYKDIARGELFPEKNFYDQAHFIKEIKKHTSATPGELFKNQNDRFLQLATIAKK